MLNKVEIRNSRGNLLVLPLENISGGYSLQDIQGLGPVKATLVSTSFAQLDGAHYQSSRRETRNIVIRLGFEPDYTTTSIQTLRRNLYNFFMTKSEINLEFFMDDGLVVDILGRVESCEPAIFSQDPAVDISIVCFDPDFYDPLPVLVSGNTTSAFTEIHYPYIGTIETGIRFVLNVDRTLTDFTIYHRFPAGDLRQLDFSAALIAGDVINISTIVGSKSVTLTRSGTQSSILYGMSQQSSWIELLPGDNYITVHAEGAAIPYTIGYDTKYGGL
jgi:hypothetical protein